jgi:hypothetical protein
LGKSSGNKLENFADRIFAPKPICTCQPKPTLHLIENPLTNIVPNAQYPNQANINYGNSAHNPQTASKKH